MKLIRIHRSFGIVASHFFLAALLSVEPICATEYTTIHCLQEAAECLGKADEQSLVIFDVDNVLITSKSAINRPVGDTYRHDFNEKYFKELSAQERIELQSTIWLQDQFCLLEPHTASTIYALQQRKVPTIALTALGTGTFGKISDMTDFRIDQLQLFCIDFSLSAPQGHHVFTNLNEVYGNYPVYKNGVLLTNWYQNKKGDVLTAFLQHAQLKPTKVLFFDDSRGNLDSVRDAMAKLKIEFVGFHYVADRLSQDSFDLATAERQFQHLCQKKEWLFDKRIMQQNS